MSVKAIMTILHENACIKLMEAERQKLPPEAKEWFDKKIRKVYKELKDKHPEKTSVALSKQAFAIVMSMWRQSKKKSETKRIEKKPKRQKRVKTKRHRRKKK